MSTLGQLIGVLFVVGLIIRYFKWIVLAVAAWLAYRWGRARGRGTAQPRMRGRLNRKQSLRGRRGSTDGHSPVTREALTATTLRLHDNPDRDG
jgi:hypothetical protein